MSAPSPLEDPMLAALDLSRPDMAAVRRAVDAGDAAAARTAFAAHLRSRRSPRWHFDPASPPQDLPAGVREEADNALTHVFDSVGIRHGFGEAIDWAYNPTTQPGSLDAADHEWTWQLNRHSAWSALARAYTATADPRYGRELARQIGDWIRGNPPPEGRADQGPYSRWRTIECGIRMFGSWPEVYYRMVRHPEVFPDQVLLAMVDCMRRHADYLDAYPTGGNWLCMEANGEFHVGVLFPEFSRAAHWRESAIGRLRREVDAQVYPDGAQMELTPGYHNVSLSNFVGALRLARLNDVPLPDGYQAGLERMYAMNLWAMSPDRDVPPLNDSWHVDAPRVLADGLQLFPGRKDWQWISSRGRQGAPPDHASHLFPWAGWAVMRSGWDPDARFLMMDCGPFGLGHQHEDKLSFVLHAYGARLVYDAGSYAYDASPMRAYVLSARGHNVVHVDGQEQSRRRGPRQAFVAKSPFPVAWHSEAGYDYAAANYGDRDEETWGAQRLRDVVHRRQVVFAKPDYWLVVDTLTPRDAAEHVYESTFHIDAPHADVDARTLAVNATSAPGPALAIVPAPVAGLEARITQGQKEPALQGWLPLAHGRTGAEPRPCLVYSLRAKGPARLAYVFAPAPTGQPAPVASLALAAGQGTLTARVGLRGGKTHTIVLRGDSVSIRKG